MHDTLHYVAPFKPRIPKYLANVIFSHSTCEVGVFSSRFINEQTEAQQSEDACLSDPHDGSNRTWTQASPPFLPINLNNRACRTPPNSIAVRGTWMFQMWERLHLSTAGLNPSVTLLPVQIVSQVLCKDMEGASDTSAKLLLIVTHT